jgi:hypothetical protein
MPRLKAEQWLGQGVQEVGRTETYQSPPESGRAEFALLAAAAEAKVEGAMSSLESGC